MYGFIGKEVKSIAISFRVCYSENVIVLLQVVQSLNGIERNIRRY